MDSLITIINKLQDVFATVGFRESEVQLPQIVVVGSQSAGKSSVIENIVGRDFLPRGTGIVTRRPLLLHLVYVPIDSPERAGIAKDGEWAVFKHLPNTTFTNFEEVREEIEAETDNIAGSNKGISDIPIVLTIYSAKLVTLTLIDLPGLIKIPVGDQPFDIETQIRQMVMGYIGNPNSIILAVTAANQDFATSEAIKIAQEVDPDGARTLGVLTKLDLMDRGTDAMDVLTGKLIPVKLGIIGVVNRSQEDIIKKKPIKECLKDEAKFLQKKYPTLASVNGISHLSRTLKKLLVEHIMHCMPELKRRIGEMIHQCQSTMLTYGEPITDKNRVLLQLITHFSNAYKETIEGTTKDIETTEMTGGARISYIFNETFAKSLDEIQPLENLSVKEILTAIRNATGLRVSLFVPEVSFEQLVKRQLKRLEKPSLMCVDHVYEEMLRIVEHLGEQAKSEMSRFPRLNSKIREVFSTLLRSRIEPTKFFISDFVKIQLGYVNSKHPEFAEYEKLIKVLQDASTKSKARDVNKLINGAQQVAFQNGNINEENSEDIFGIGAFYDRISAKIGEFILSSREKRDCAVIEGLIEGYFNVVRRGIQDMVPKTVVHFLVDYVKDNLQSELIQKLYNNESMDTLLTESEHMTQKRADLAEMLEALNKANTIIGEIGYI